MNRKEYRKLVLFIDNNTHRHFLNCLNYNLNVLLFINFKANHKDRIPDIYSDLMVEIKKYRKISSNKKEIHSWAKNNFLTTKTWKDY